MRTTTFVSLLGVAALAVLTGCTVKDVDQPALAGPSTFAHSINMVADKDTLTQNGVDFTDIRITALGPDGQSESIPLNAQLYVNGVAADYGTLSTKTPTTPTTIRYTAPPASTVAAGQVPQTVTLVVTPRNAGDFRGETPRQLDLRLLPQGVIIPSNPNLQANFTFAPTSPKVLDLVTFDATGTLNSGTACGAGCTYSWNFGDGTSAAGQVTTHQFRTVGTFQVTLTVMDFLGAVSTKIATITVTAGTPPTVSFTVSPTPPPTNVDIFFNATASAPATGRTITSYSWEFGDGQGASGPIVSHKYTGVGTFVVVLTVTDDAGATGRSQQTLAVGTAASNPTAALTTTVSGRRVVADASASTAGTGGTIVSYKFDYGDGSLPETVTNPVQSHTYTAPGTFVVSVEVTDSNGKTATKTASVTVS